MQINRSDQSQGHLVMILSKHCKHSFILDTILILGNAPWSLTSLK